MHEYEVSAAIGPAHSPRRPIPIQLQDLTAGSLDATDTPERLEQPTGLVCPKCRCTYTATYGPFCYDCNAQMVPDHRGGASVPVCHSTAPDFDWSPEQMSADLTRFAAATLDAADRDHEAAQHAVELARLVNPSRALSLLAYAYTQERRHAQDLYDTEATTRLDYAVQGIETAAWELM